MSALSQDRGALTVNCQGGESGLVREAGPVMWADTECEEGREVVATEHLSKGDKVYIIVLCGLHQLRYTYGLQGWHELPCKSPKCQPCGRC